MSFRRRFASAFLLSSFAALAVLPRDAAAAPFGYTNPKPLPAPSGNIVTVSTISQLNSALQNLQTGQTVLIAAGTYNIASVSDALYVRQGVSNWSIRGATGNRNDVILQGAGMNGSVRFGLWLGTSTNGTIADLTIRNIRDHGILANYGAHNVLFHNLRIVDTGDQFLKSNPGSPGVGNESGIVEYSVFEYSIDEAGGSVPEYTNGVDVHGGNNWIIRYNLFKNIVHRPGFGLAGPAVLMWNTSKNSVVDGNTFINCARGVALGLIDQSGRNDHEGGTISNNFFFRAAAVTSTTDAPISIADAPNVKISHNTSLDLGSYPNAVEYRFASTAGTQIRNNLLNRAISARDGASGASVNNLLQATPTLFENPSTGDLHLKSSASAAIDKVGALPEALTDLDGDLRPSGGSADYGADEFPEGADTLSPGVPESLRVLP